MPKITKILLLVVSVVLVLTVFLGVNSSGVSGERPRCLRHASA